MTKQATTKTVSKMTKARAIWNEIFTKGYDLKGRGQRAVFIDRCMNEIEMTKNGAATYYQNISNKVNKGMKLYHYNKPTKKVNKKDVKAAEAEVLLSLPHLAKHRWMVINEAEVEVNNFPSRAQAQSFAKDNGFKWADRTKLSA